MMKSVIRGSWFVVRGRPARRSLGAGMLLAAAAAMLLLAGCIADTAEDTNLPWASSRSWEGMAPIAPSLINQYE